MDLWIQAQGKDESCSIATIQTCHPVYFKRDSNLELITINILVPKLNAMEPEGQPTSMQSDPDRELTSELTQDSNSTGMRAGSQSGQAAEATSGDEQEGACCEAPHEEPIDASEDSYGATAAPNVKQAPQTEDAESFKSARVKMEGSQMCNLHDVTDIALELLANMTISSRREHGREWYMGEKEPDVDQAHLS